MTMHRVFGEMYNLKTIAGILAEQPLHRGEAGPGGEVAGPPFEMPYSLNLPASDIDAWRLQRELLAGSIELCTGLLAHGTTPWDDYLRALVEIDRRSTEWHDAIIGQPGRRQ
jgi:hypothetical protein